MWQGATEVTYQVQELTEARADFLRYYLYVTAEDRLFVRNSFKLGLWYDGRHFGNGEAQPSEQRPRFTGELRGQGYSLTGLYSPFLREVPQAADQRERQYNVTLVAFPTGFPVTLFAFDRLTRSLDHVPDDSRNTYTLSLDYPRRTWRVMGRLLHQYREFDFMQESEKLTTASLDNSLNLTRKHWGTEGRYLLEHTRRNLTTGYEDFFTVHHLAARIYAEPQRKLTLGADYDGRFASGQVESTTLTEPTSTDYVASARARYRPFRFLEGAAIRHRSESQNQGATDAKSDYTQLQVSVTGRVLLSMSGTASVYRTWMHRPGQDGETDASYVRIAGNLWPHTEVSVEASYAHMHEGVRPVSTVRAATLQSQLLRDSRLQLQYAAQGSSADIDFFAIERQYVTATWQQNLGTRSLITAGYSRRQDPVLSSQWYSEWFASGTLSVRHWALLSGTFNRLPDIVVAPQVNRTPTQPRRIDAQLTLYPESRWVWNANWYTSTDALGREATFWGGTIQYRL